MLLYYDGNVIGFLVSWHLSLYILFDSVQFRSNRRKQKFDNVF